MIHVQNTKFWTYVIVDLFYNTFMINHANSLRLFVKDHSHHLTSALTLAVWWICPSEIEAFRVRVIITLQNYPTYWEVLNGSNLLKGYFVGFHSWTLQTGRLRLPNQELKPQLKREAPTGSTSPKWEWISRMQNPVIRAAGFRFVLTTIMLH